MESLTSMESWPTCLCGKSGNRGRRVVELGALGCREDADASLLFRILLGKISRTHRGKIRIPRLSERELPYEMVEDLGFEEDRGYVRYGIRTQ